MKKIVSVILAVMMLLSCFAGLSFNAFAADTPQNGWYQEDGDWQYYKDGVAQTGWQKIKNVWYWFDESGWMAADGIYTINEKCYFFAESGALKTGWIKMNWTGYYGDTYTEWYYADSNGVLQKGWKKINGKWYYFEEEDFEEDFYMYCEDAYEIDGKLYAFDENGALITGGWGKITKTYETANYTSTYTYWYYADNNGVCATGWKKIDGKWYYFDEEYAYMYSGGVYYVGDEDNKEPYYFTESGAMATGWVKGSRYGYGPTSADFGIESTYTAQRSYYSYSNEEWFYANSKGVLQSGWQKINNKWYFFDEEDFYMYVGDCNIEDAEGNDKEYFFNKDGAWVNNGWCEVYGTWFYVKNGELQTGWQKINNKWYFFEEDGWMAIGGYQINGKDYLFNGDGSWVANPANGWHKVTFSGTYYDGTTVTMDYWYYMTNGTLATGWKAIGGKWYYFSNPLVYIMSDEEEEDTYTGSIGRMYSSTTVYDYDESSGKAYAVDANGAMITKTGWVKLEYPAAYKTVYGSDCEWVYVNNAKGELANDGWKKVSGKWYWFYPDGEMIYDAVRSIENKDGSYSWYYFGKDGALVEKAGWAKVTETYSDDDTYTSWYYLNNDGTCVKGWKQVGSKWYYFADSSWNGPYMYCNTSSTIDGTNYRFDKTGALFYPSTPVLDL